MVVTLLELLRGDTELRKVANIDGGEYAGPCPWCRGEDRFRAWPHRERPRYWCRQCGRQGDAIQYLRERNGLTFPEACERLGQPLPQTSHQPSTPKPPPLAKPPNSAWQARGRAFIDHCVQTLWSPQGRRALAYLRTRGLHDDTLRAAHVGYHPKMREEPREAWGLAPDPEHEQVWLPCGIIFPWFVGLDLWKVTVRRDGGGIPKHRRYISLPGGGNPLYRINMVQPNQPAMLVEGTLDALSIAQEAGDLIVAVSASTTWGRLERWIGRLALALVVLLSFDADEAGDAAAAWWRKALGPRAKRWQPY
jgi:DNA primase